MKKKISLSEPWITKDEKRALISCINKNQISTFGENVKKLEKKLELITKSKYNLAVNSGTAALILILKSLGIKENDLVITQSYTFSATVNAIVAAGGVPWLFDISKKDFNLDVNKIEKALKNYGIQKRGFFYHKKTKQRIFAICPVLTFSIVPNLPKIKELQKKYNLKNIGDAACALGASFKKNPLSNYFDALAYSLNGNKTITSGGGGIISTNNKAIFSKSKIMSENGKHGKGYNYKYLGYNFKMTNLHASIALQQLKKIKIIFKNKKYITNLYKKNIKNVNINFLPEVTDSFHVNWINFIITNDIKTAKNLIKYLRQKKILTDLFWRPIHLQKISKNFIIDKDQKFSSLIWNKMVPLPSSSNLRNTEILMISNYVNKFLKKVD